MELQILAAMLKSRESFDKISSYIALKNYTTEFNLLVKYVREYYGRDREAQAVDVEVIQNQIQSTLDNDKHIALFVDWIKRADATDISSHNVEEVILGARLREIETQLAAAWAGGTKKVNTDALLEEYTSLRGATSLLDLDSEEPIQVLENVDIEALFARRNRENLLPIFPKSLGSRLDGGIEPGDHVLIYGLTELGKSAMAINMACGIANSKKLVLYLGNEDKTERMYERIVCCLSGMTRYEVAENPQRAMEKATHNGLPYIKMIGIHPGSVKLIEGLVEKYDPKAIVVDQLRNLNTPTRNNKVVQLEEAAVGVRNLAKKAGVAAITVSQAGDSARNKRFLDTGDVDFSNVGIPGTCDVMIGFGADEEMMQRNERGISLAKNKISGNHDQFYVRINPALSRILDV